MKNRITYKFNFIIILASLFLLTGCESYLRNEGDRYFSGFFITLIIGIVGFLIILFSKKKNK